MKATVFGACPLDGFGYCEADDGTLHTFRFSQVYGYIGQEDFPDLNYKTVDVTLNASGHVTHVRLLEGTK